MKKDEKQKFTKGEIAISALTGAVLGGSLGFSVYLLAGVKAGLTVVFISVIEVAVECLDELKKGGGGGDSLASYYYDLQGAW